MDTRREMKMPMDMKRKMKTLMPMRIKRKLLRFMSVGAEVVCIVLMFSLVCTVEAMAKPMKTDQRVICENDNGERIDCVNQYYFTEEGVRFKVQDTEGEACYRVCYGDGEIWSAYLPMEKEEDYYTLYAENSGHEYARYRFFEIRTDGEAAEIGSGNFYGIRYDMRPKLPSATLSMKAFQKILDVYYVSAQPPKLTILEGRSVNTYVEVRNEEEESEKKYPVEGTLTLEFLEGRYTVDVVYVEEQGGGGIAESLEGYPISFVYDENPPDSLTVELIGAQGMQIFPDRSDYQLIQSKNIGIEVSAKDSLSGVDKYFIRYGNEIDASEKVTLKSGFSGDVEAWAVDRCGNESKHYRLTQKLLIEDKPPTVQVACNQSNNRVYADIHFSDEESGLSQIRVEMDGELLKTDDFSETDICNRHRVNVEIPAGYLANAGATLSISCTDFAGNETNLTCPVKFVDENAPRIEIEGVNKGEVTSKPVGLKIAIEDENIRQESVAVRGSVTKGGESRELSLERMEKLYFEEDGFYRINVTAEDLYGNSAQKETTFTIDTKPPTIEGLDSIDKTLFEKFSIKDKLSGMFRDDTPVLYNMYVNGKDYFEEDIETPGEYTILVYAVDQAGNQSKEKATFTVGRKDGKSKSGETPQAESAKTKSAKPETTQAESTETKNTQTETTQTESTKKKASKIESAQTENAQAEITSPENSQIGNTESNQTEIKKSETKNKVEKLLILLFFILAITFIVVILSIVRSTKSDI